ncbi:MAG: PD-(D/E)XK nuclease family protein [Anaerolineales bacterium]
MDDQEIQSGMTGMGFGAAGGRIGVIEVFSEIRKASVVSALLLAPAAHGKTQYSIQHIQERLVNEPLAPITVILPNQMRVSEFRRRLAAAGGVMGVNLVTFHNLYAQVLARAGQPRARLSSPVQVRLLRTIIDQLCEEGRLQHYIPLRTKPGFVTALRTIIEELKRARIEPGDFSVAVSGMGDHLSEIAAIYARYQDWLLEENWADPEGQGWLAALALDHNPQLEAGLRLLVVNGFDEFNPTQLGVLTLLAQRADETIITLTGDLERPHRLAHQRFQRAQEAITTALAIAPGPLPSISPTSILLDHLETHLFESPVQPITQALNPAHFIESPTRASEARAALRWIKTRLVKDGFELSDVAILARDLTPYQPFLEETAAEFGMPLRVLGGLPLAENPAVAALLNLLSISALDWPRRPVIAAWRSPYFDWSAEKISPADAVSLDSASRLGRVIKGLDQWRACFELLVQRIAVDGSMIEDEDPINLHLQQEDGSDLKEKFNVFVSRITPPAHGSLRDYAAFIENLIGDDPLLATRYASPEDDDSLKMVIRARENPATAERDLAALQAFKDVLRGLVLAEAVLESESLTYADFFVELRGAVDGATYSAVPESGVLVASVLDARTLSFRAVAILGLSEGEFPQWASEDPFLSEAERATLREGGLPLESKLHGDEATFFYQAVTRAREQLLFCRPSLADDGQPWEPSPYWLEVWRMFGEPEIQYVRPEDNLSPEQTASAVEFTQASTELDPHIQRGISILTSRLSSAAASHPHDGNLPELSAVFSSRYAAHFGWSASKLESYGTCPFYFYVAYTLELEPRTPPEEGYDARMLGSMLHQILEFTYQRADDATDLDTCLQLMPQIAQEVFETAPADYGFRPTPLWEMQQSELTTILEDTITALADISQGYIPSHFEPRFGMGEPSLVLQTEIGDVRLHGYIDRVDSGPDGRLRIIDYKAGSAAILPRHLEEGRRLQLPIYALAARDALSLGEIGGGFYWHIGKAAASSLKLEKYPGGVQAAFDRALQHVGSHVRNIRAGRFSPYPPKDGCPQYCPAIAFCWKYTAKGF